MIRVHRNGSQKYSQIFSTLFLIKKITTCQTKWGLSSSFDTKPEFLSENLVLDKYMLCFFQRYTFNTGIDPRVTMTFRPL